MAATSVVEKAASTVETKVELTALKPAVKLVAWMAALTVDKKV